MSEKHRSKILVVDDDVLNVRLIEAQLMTEYDIRAAYSGEEALDLIDSDKPDLVILDVMMPGMSGYDVCRRMKSSKDTCFIPVIIVTALSSRNDRMEGIMAGADEFLTKPFDRFEVLTRVRTLLKSKQLYDELIAEGDRTKKYLDIAGCIIVAFDVDLTVTIANAKCNEVLGYAEGELIGSSWLEKAVPADERERVESLFRNILKDDVRSVESFESNVLTKTGQKKLISWRNSYVKDSTGKITTILSSGSDITEQRQSEQKIKVSEEKFRALFENAVDSIMILDMDHNILEVNPSLCDLLLYRKDEMLQLSRSDLIAPEYLHKYKEYLVSALEKEHSVFETECLKKDGSRVPVEMSIKVIEYEGKPAILSNGRDITERKQSERTLQESEEKYRMLAENANDVIWTMDKEGKLLYVSPSVIKLRGYTPEEVMNQCFPEIFSQDSILKIRLAMDAFFSDVQYAKITNRTEIMELEQLHKQGYTVWTEALATPLFDKNGNFKFFVGVTRDISERKKSQEAIQKYVHDLGKANESLHSLDRMKDEFISNLSHELKTPLISIKGYSELVHDEVLGPLTDKQKNAMHIVLDKYDHLSFLLDSLIYISIARSGKVNYRFDPLRIEDALKKVMDYFSFKATDKNIKLVRNFESGLPLVKGDVEYIPYIFRSVIDNAIKFSKSEGVIEVSAYRDDGNVHVVVKDNGIGIPKAEFSNIFNPFYQVDSSLTRRYGGSGLGLHVSKTITEVHSGSIWIESEEGKGTAVHVSFPSYSPSHTGTK
ncbi:PAS/PAC sensor signal transduction histidine kinase [Methanolobus psychrophilus R15]|nr:PAS/PAC sensor signal transduction histidine kinase [Methanolobus psychrophilus R15]